MNKKIISALLITWIFGATLVSGVSAYKWDPSVLWPNYSEDRHEAMEEAFVNNDYNARLELMDWKWRVTQIINEDNFAQFVEAHNLAEAWNLKAAKEIRTELGLGLKDGSNRWMWKWRTSWARWNCIYNN